MGVAPSYKSELQPGDTVQMNAIDTRTSRLGRNARATATTTGSALQSGDLELNGVSVRATNASDDLLSTSMADQSGIALASAINSSTAASGVTATVNATTISSGAVQGGTLDANNSVTINDFTLTGFDVNASDGGDTLMEAINASADETGVTASRDQAGNLELVAQDGRNIVVETTGTASQITGLSDGVTMSSVTVESANTLNIGGNDPTAANLNAGSQGPSPDSALSNVDVSTQSGAQDAIARIDRALEEVSSRRSDLGSMQNRLESTVSNLSVASENTQNARSRIADADFAKPLN